MIVLATLPRCCASTPSVVSRCRTGIRSGYAIVTTDGKIYQMYPTSNENTTKWIVATSQDATWRVDVKGRVQDALLEVTKIQLAK